MYHFDPHAGTYEHSAHDEEWDFYASVESGRDPALAPNGYAWQDVQEWPQDVQGWGHDPAGWAHPDGGSWAAEQYPTYDDAAWAAQGGWADEVPGFKVGGLHSAEGLNLTLIHCYPDYSSMDLPAYLAAASHQQLVNANAILAATQDSYYDAGVAWPDPSSHAAMQVLAAGHPYTHTPHAPHLPPAYPGVDPYYQHHPAAAAQPAATRPPPHRPSAACTIKPPPPRRPPSKPPAPLPTPTPSKPPAPLPTSSPSKAPAPLPSPPHGQQGPGVGTLAAAGPQRPAPPFRSGEAPPLRPSAAAPQSPTSGSQARSSSSGGGSSSSSGPVFSGRRGEEALMSGGSIAALAASAPAWVLLLNYGGGPK
ncbi:hypothetical protein QJQ45_014582, partial [Haematococcus lacustris]